MRRRPPGSTRTYTLLPYTTHFRSLHLEALPHGEALDRLHHLTAEAPGEHVVAAEGDLADHTGDGERLVGALAVVDVVVVAAAPAGIHPDDATPGRPPSDLLRAGGQRRGQRQIGRTSWRAGVWPDGEGSV